MSNVHKILPHYTYEDWVQWEGKWELIDGHPIAMSPAPVPRHQRIVADMIIDLGIALRKKKCGNCFVYDSIDYKISEDTILEPDVLIVCGEIIKKFLDFPPALVVEVASPSTALRDRHTKFEIYQQKGVKYYVLVDAERASIEIYTLLDGIYQLQELNQNSFEFTLEDGCKIMVDFSNIEFNKRKVIG